MIIALIPTQLIAVAYAQSKPAGKAVTGTPAPAPPVTGLQAAKPFDLSSSLASLPPLPRNEQIKDRNPVVDPAEATRR